jgi:hypothetical protein
LIPEDDLQRWDNKLRQYPSTNQLLDTCPMIDVNLAKGFLKKGLCGYLSAAIAPSCWENEAGDLVDMGDNVIVSMIPP